MNLTNALLKLDKEIESRLKNAKSSNLKEKEELSRYIEKLKDEAITLFEDQKNREGSELDKKIEQKQLEVMSDLRRKMKKFDENVDIDTLAEQLYSLVKEQACH